MKMMNEMLMLRDRSDNRQPDGKGKGTEDKRTQSHTNKAMHREKNDCTSCELLVACQTLDSLSVTCFDPEFTARTLYPSAMFVPEASWALGMREDDDEKLRCQGAERHCLRASSGLSVNPIEPLNGPRRDRRSKILV